MTEAVRARPEILDDPSLCDATAGDFETTLRRHALAPLSRERVATVQVNVGKLCNQACLHCHVEAGPKRRELMERRDFERIVELIDGSTAVDAIDLTGGAPELNPNFRWFVGAVHERGIRTIVRCNLTVIFVEGQEDLPEFYRDHQVNLVCSLPCYSADNVDRQRGRGVFERSIDALQALNALGYGKAESELSLDLVYNPTGAALPPPQAELEQQYRDELMRSFGIEFGNLLTITNMPIKRFADQLQQWGAYERYMELLVDSFNPHTAAALMCRSLISIGWDGVLYDCDFNQMLEIPARGRNGRPTIWDIERLEDLGENPIRTAAHCFGCTAGAGSSCGGALE